MVYYIVQRCRSRLCDMTVKSRIYDASVMHSKISQNSLIPIIACWFCIAWNVFGTFLQAFFEYAATDYLSGSTTVPSEGTYKSLQK